MESADPRKQRTGQSATAQLYEQRSRPESVDRRPSGLALAKEWLAIRLRQHRMEHPGTHDRRFDPVDRPPRLDERGASKGIGSKLRDFVTEEQPVPDDTASAAEARPPEQLVGLALSGGGIRSATFSLGVLQALHEAKMLRLFDYLSTVSGGGFTGGWWSAWLSREEREVGRLFPDPERLEPDRYPPRVLDEDGGSPPRTEDTDVPEGSKSVRLDDPIHHLRLFANYLTPRKGMLSGDTWRAVTVISRNLVLTWLVLVPLMFAAIALSQVYFVSEGRHAIEFVCSRPDLITRTAVPAQLSGTIASGTAAGSVLLPRQRSDTVSRWETTRACTDAGALAGASGGVRPHAAVLADRARLALRPLAAAAIVTVALTLLWLLFGSGRPWLALGGLIGTGLIARKLADVWSAASSGSGGGAWDRLFGSPIGRLWLLAGLVGALLAIGYAAKESIQGLLLGSVPRDRMRNRLAHFHATVLVTVAVLVVTFVIAGFGHEIVAMLFAGDAGLVARSGGWSAVAVTVGSAIFTALKAAPSAQEADRVQRPNVVSRAIFKIAPTLTLLLLAILLAHIAHGLLARWGTADVAHQLGLSLVSGMAILYLFAIFEASASMRLERGMRRRALVLFAALGVAAAVAFFAARRLAPVLLHPEAWRIGFAITAVALVAVAFRLTTTREGGRTGERASLRLRHGWGPIASRTPAWLALLLAAGAATLVVVFIPPFFLMLRSADATLPADASARLAMIGLAGVLFGVLFIICELAIGRGDNDRAMSLVMVAALWCAVPVVQNFLPHDVPQVWFSEIALTTAGLAVVWVIAFGWAIDPNLISLHTFYRARLVRAYLGASNTKNRRQQEITESARGDDVNLADVWNHAIGAPYHLVNTTLNLVGGRDLTTAQRSAANFVLSKYYCGSARTGYRETPEYMAGAMQLGTAVAISGAAVSPNMGAKSVSAALSMLLALFNVRIGFWAPTPNKKRWNEAQPRLWPFYLLRESLSQTNDLATYCYLTDGGHFDNTGLYALVERGCQYIIVVDNGADPQPCFSDMGQAIRRCRIDFAAEIALPIAPFENGGKNALPDSHHVAGTITYNDDHLALLGYAASEIPRRRKGVIVWIKPSIVKDADSVDVLQYKLENDAFPQQTTADQWYDESQFESYRALGFLSAAEVVRAGGRALRPATDPSLVDAAPFFTELLRKSTGGKGPDELPFD